jgi:hypothetical protein
MRSKGNDTKNIERKMELLENAPAHQSVLIKDFLAENDLTVMEHFPFS